MEHTAAAQAETILNFTAWNDTSSERRSRSDSTAQGVYDKQRGARDARQSTKRRNDMNFPFGISAR